MTQELSEGHSSEVSHPTGNGPGVGGKGGEVTGGCVGLGVGTSATGGSPGLDGPAMGLIGSPSGVGLTSVTGSRGMIGLSVSIA